MGLLINNPLLNIKSPVLLQDLPLTVLHEKEDADEKNLSPPFPFYEKTKKCYPRSCEPKLFRGPFGDSP